MRLRRASLIPLAHTAGTAHPAQPGHRRPRARQQKNGLSLSHEVTRQDTTRRDG